MATWVLMLGACRGLSAYDFGTDPDGDSDDVTLESGIDGETGESDVPGPNTPPVADAGPDGGAKAGDTVSLDGSGSHDADGDGLSYAWELKSKPTKSRARLVNPASETAQFFADVDGEYVAILTVSDGDASASDETVWTVASPNSGPIANAGADQSVSVNDTVQLNGTGSTDPDGDTLTYRWTLSGPSGSFATLDVPTSSTPRFTADVAGSYQVQLTVSDGTASASDSMTVTASTSSGDDCLSSCAEGRDAAARRVVRGGWSLTPLAALLPFLAIAFGRRPRR